MNKEAIMKRKFFLAGALFLALGVIGLLGQQDGNNHGQQGADLTGVWYWQNIFGDGVLPSILTFHNDGTVLCSDALAFGGIPPTMNPYTLTPFYGVWERTRRHEYTATWLSLAFNRETGILAGIVRSRANFAFADHFDQIAGTMFVEMLACPSFLTCPDPLAPNAAWAPWTQLSFHAARVSIVPY
jgi:hypothetical protein